MTAAPTVTLPALREDLQLLEGAPSREGAATWMIYDPVRHRYFQVNADAFRLLTLWRETALADFTSDASIALDRAVTSDEIEEVVKFLFANHLTVDPPGGDARAYARPLQKKRRQRILGAVHSYLFFRISLVRPARFLEATAPLLAPLYTRAALWAVIATTLAGLYLASRQWNTFTATFLDLLSWHGALLYAVSLVFIKILHELAHAYTATRHGVRVNTMGIAFMVMMPILFTDVTDAWKLRSRSARLQIAAAGMAVELAIAGIATFFWAFLPDGPARSIAFVLATTSWIMSLAVNLNPFMRFDGYYLLSDAWRMENLQPRAFALARWWLREALFGLGHAPPEMLEKSKRAAVILYGFAVWIYRLVLFIGIALLVYHLFFKVLGVILFIIEITWFIALPIVREIAEWIKMRRQILRSGRTVLTGAALLALLALFFIPWTGTVRVPAVALAEQEFAIFAPRPARIETLALVDGGHVASGDELAVLVSPGLTHQIIKARHNIALAQARLERAPADSRDLASRSVIARTLATEHARLAGFLEEQRRMVIKAPMAGEVRDVRIDVAAGEWIDEEAPLARIVSGKGREARGYVHEDDLWKLVPGQSAMFVPEDPLITSRQGRLRDVAPAGSRAIELPYVASVFGGAIPSDRTSEGEIRPRAGRYQIIVRLDGAPLDRAVRGTLLLDGRPESLAAAFWRRLLQVLVRESGV